MNWKKDLPSMCNTRASEQSFVEWMCRRVDYWIVHDLPKYMSKTILDDKIYITKKLEKFGNPNIQSYYDKIMMKW